MLYGARSVGAHRRIVRCGWTQRAEEASESLTKQNVQGEQTKTSNGDPRSHIRVTRLIVVQHPLGLVSWQKPIDRQTKANG
jgi:hypothetical protein